MGYVLATIALLIAYATWRLVRFWKAAYGVASAEVHQRWEADKNLVEVAPWFGKTGLSEEAERELPRYLRREFGEVGADDGLKAADLTYLGIQTDDQGRAHFWSIPKREGEDDYAYAYIDIDEKGYPLCYGWGGRDPVHLRPAL
nr:hypothetical protein [uncultured Rhodoferax sp.]